MDDDDDNNSSGASPTFFLKKQTQRVCQQNKTFLIQIKLEGKALVNMVL